MKTTREELGAVKHFAFDKEVHSIDTIRLKNVGEAFSCSVCQGGYKYEYSLKRHVLKSHVNRAYITNSDCEVFGEITLRIILRFLTNLLIEVKYLI